MAAARGRPPKPLPADAPPGAAKLAAELRRRRLKGGLTQAVLGTRAGGYSGQHISDIELARAGATRSCVAALDAALAADGALLDLLPAAVAERLAAADARAAARRRYDEDDVDPTNRRGLLLGGAAGAALGTVALSPARAVASEVDPELPAHWDNLLSLLGRHDAAHGPREVLRVVERELRLIAEHRAVARGELRTALMRVEARWSQFAAWLSNDANQPRGAAGYTDRALRLAREAGYPDVIVLARSHQSQWAAQEGDAHRSIALAEDALRVPGASAQASAYCRLQAACGHALAHDAEACERSLSAARALVEHADPPVLPWASGFPVAPVYVRAVEARCWLSMRPRKAVSLYDDALREWPRDRLRTGGVHQARLALACAGAGELDRARAEGRKALAVARATKSAAAARELRRLGAVLNAA